MTRQATIIRDLNQEVTELKARNKQLEESMTTAIRRADVISGNIDRITLGDVIKDILKKGLRS